MKRNIIVLISAFLGLVMSFTACQPEKFELGAPISKSELKFSITQNPADPNMVIMVSETPGMTPHWNTPLGRSTRLVDTVRLAFPGEYQFKYGVQSSGGYIESDAVTISITTTNTNYIEDELWTLLSGGVDNEKTWYLDLNAEKTCKYFAGPLYFYGTDNGWLGDCYGDGEGDDCWSWEADYAGNSWVMPEGDYGSITFDLKGNANVNANHLMLGRTESGKYTLDADAKTIKMTDAGILHDAGRDGQVIDWGNIKIITLTKDYMQLAALRDPALSGEGACLLVYNFISKDYSDNWVPGEPVEPEPTLPDGWQDDVSQVVSTAMVWKLSPETPFNWCNLDGSLMNPWNKISDYPDWTGFNATVPATYEKFSLIMNSKDNSVKYTTPSGTESIGSYTLDEKGVYTFTSVTPAFNICSWVNLFTTAENQWRIMSLDKDALGNVTGMWVGARDAVKPEYAAFHLVVEAGSGQVDPTQAVKNILCSKTWVIDSNRSYDVTTSWGKEQGPVIFSDYATWSWNPLPGEQYAAGEASIDYGTVKFELNGKVTVNQRKRIYTYDDAGTTKTRNGLPLVGDVLVSDDLVTLTGIWVLDLDDNTLTLSVGMLHPWTCDYAVANWGALTIYRIEENALLLQEMRDATLSGESAMPLTYIFVPSAKKKSTRK